MFAERPCSVCRRWFRPDAMSGGRQQVCGAPECQRERHRRACGQWHARNPDYDPHTRFMIRLVKDEPAGSRSVMPLETIDWDLARKVVGLKVTTLVEETGKVILRRARDTGTVQPK